MKTSVGIKEAKKKRFEAANKRFLAIAAGAIKTPVYLLDETLIEENMRVLKYVKERTGCKILHALKAFASFAVFPMMGRYLDGTCASGLNEARLGREKFGGEVHTFSPAYKKEEIAAVLRYSDCVIFNSFYQLEKYGKAARKKGVEIGLRVNPGHCEIAHDMYNPCTPLSRLGVTHDIFDREFPGARGLVDGLHFHAMCEQGSDVMERVLASFERLYGPYIEGLRWVNFGGGHHITRDDYDIDRLVSLINAFKKKYGVQVYLEPGEASVLNAGVLIATVIDIVRERRRDSSPRRLSRDTHARRASNALQAASPGLRRARRKEAHIPHRRTKLPRGRCNGRLLIRQSSLRAATGWSLQTWRYTA